MKHTLWLAVAASVLLGAVASEATAVIDAPVPKARSRDATVQDYREVLQLLKSVRETLNELDAALGHGKAKQDEGWQEDCRGYSPEKTVRCAAAQFKPEGGAEKAVSVWQCESNFGTEPPHTDAYHGPFQYLYSTYEGQQNQMPDVVEWYGLSAAVHDMRSNILTAVAWAARHGWGPWSCA